MDCCQIDGNWLIRIRDIWINLIQWVQVGVDVIQIDVIKSYRIFAPNFSNFKITLALSIFKNVVASKVFNLNFLWIIPQRAPVGEIRISSVKDSKAPGVSWWDSITTITPRSNSSNTFHICNLWDYAPYGFRWVHADSVIFVPLEIDSNFVTTIPTLKGDVPIIVSLSINGSARLISVNDIFSQTYSM